MKKFILAIALMGASTAHADISQVEAQFKACADKAVTTVDMNTCAAQAYGAANAELATVYQSLRVRFSQPDADSIESLKRLDASEVAWTTYRSTNCDMYGLQMLGGTGEISIIGDCLVQTTVTRVKDLQSLFAPR